MLDNNLLKYFSKYATKDGCLNLSSNEFEIVEGRDDFKFFDFLHCKEGIYFTKCTPKPIADAEILMGQIYNLLGLNSAIYLPAKQNEESTYLQVVSNNVIRNNYVYACEQLDKIREKTGQLFSLELPQRKIDNVVDYSKLITKEAMAKQILLRVADVATKNTDRNTSNYAYKVEDGIITDLATFDHGACGTYPFNNNYAYYHDFECDNLMSDYQFLLMLRDNENIPDYVSFEDMADKIGSVDVSGIAEDIYQTINYKIEQKLVDNTLKQMDYVANALVCSEQELINI